jgi:DNA-binding CsgD family transcriptional regulator
MNNLSQPILQQGSIEFFAHQGQAFVFVDGEKMPVADAPVRVHQMILRDIEHHPGALPALESMNINDPLAQHEQYVMCMHGELNAQPDFINFKPNIADREFIQLICGVTQCKHRGVLCQRIHGQYGELTGRESIILHLIGKGGRPQEIADSLNISIHTVRCHIDNIRSKIGADSLLGVGIFANFNKF